MNYDSRLTLYIFCLVLLLLTMIGCSMGIPKDMLDNEVPELHCHEKCVNNGMNEHCFEECD